MSAEEPAPKRGLTLLKRVKLIAVALVALLILIVVFQNTEAVDTRLLFITITMPRAVLLFGTFIAGFILGIVACNRVFARK